MLTAFFDDQQRFVGAIEDFYFLGNSSNKNDNDKFKRIIEYRYTVGSFASTCGKDMVGSFLCEVNVLKSQLIVTHEYQL